MLVNFEDVVKPYANLKRRHEGLVVVVEDPKNLGRIKVKIQGILETDNLDSLPWVYPRESTTRGGRPDSAETAVPPLDSMVTIEFPQFGDYPLLGGNIYYPVWSGMTRVDMTNPPIAQTNPTPEDPGLTYPYDASAPSEAQDIETNVWVKTISENVSWIRIDKNLGSIEYYDQDSDTAFRWDRGGNIEVLCQSLHVEVRESARFKIGEDLHFQVGNNTFIDTTVDTTINTGEDFGVNAGDNIDMQAQNAVGITAVEATVGIFSGTATGITAGTEVEVQAGTEFGVAAGSNIAMTAGGDITAASGADMGFTSGGILGLQAGGVIGILGAGNVDITSAVMISELAPIIARDGVLLDNEGAAVPAAGAPTGSPDTPVGELGTIAALLELLAAAKEILTERFTFWEALVESLQGEAATTREAGQQIKEQIIEWAASLVGTVI